MNLCHLLPQRRHFLFAVCENCVAHNSWEIQSREVRGGCEDKWSRFYLCVRKDCVTKSSESLTKSQKGQRQESDDYI